MRVIDKLTMPGNKINEDIIWYNEVCAVLLDGSTGLSGATYNAVDFVEAFVNSFSKSIIADNLRDAFNSTIDELCELFSSEQEDSWYIPPSAAGVIVYDCGDYLKLICYGDCSALLFYNNNYCHITSNDIELFDNSVIDQMIKIRNQSGADISEIIKKEEIKKKLIENRKKMNKKDGYKVIAPNSCYIVDDDIIEISKKSLNKCILYSDGFKLVESELIKGNCKLKSLYKMLRVKEDSDPCLNSYPRFFLNQICLYYISS